MCFKNDFGQPFQKWVLNENVIFCLSLKQSDLFCIMNAEAEKRNKKGSLYGKNFWINLIYFVISFFCVWETF